MSLYFCSECRYPPLAWRDGRGYCLNHAVACGVEIAQSEKPKIRQSSGSGFDLRRGKNNLSRKMAALEAELKSTGNWEGEIDLSSVAHDNEMLNSNPIYMGLNGELRDLPF